MLGVCLATKGRLFMRLIQIGSLVLLGSMASACSGGVVERVVHEGPIPTPGVDAGSPPPIAVGTGGDAAVLPIPVAVPDAGGVDDSGTLSVTIAITALGK